MGADLARVINEISPDGEMSLLHFFLHWSNSNTDASVRYFFVLWYLIVWYKKDGVGAFMSISDSLGKSAKFIRK
jgi:hypothetical protein